MHCLAQKYCLLIIRLVSTSLKEEVFCGSSFGGIYFGDSYPSLPITFQQNLLEFHHASVMFFEIGSSETSIQQFYFPATFQIVCIVCNSFL